jgi:osmotically-inducible protein OsmY
MKTDSQIQHDVLAELKWEPSVTATDIGVEVKDGIVTLAGHVAHYAEKWGAERAARRVSGVKAIAVEIDVHLGGFSKRSDGDIAKSVQNTLAWASYLPLDAVKVMVEDGWVTLTGAVDWDYQRTNASKSVSHMMGVVGVNNLITLKTQVTPSAVKADIEAVLKRRVNGNANTVHVEVHGHDVTLSGSVHNWYERSLAANCAWGTPGVQRVTDNITVSH